MGSMSVERTAAVWGAWDRDDDVLYVYSEHYRGQAEPVIHAESIRSRGQWIPGVIDPASRGRGRRMESSCFGPIWIWVWTLYLPSMLLSQASTRFG